MADVITLNGDYEYTQFRYNSGDTEAIDASDATWIVANKGSDTNLYPFLVDNAKTGIDIYGATINGEISLTAEWLSIYVNSAALMVRDTQQADIYDVRIDQAWDGIRIAGDSDGFDISNVWVSNVRDDAFENDNPVSGTIRDSLSEGVFSGISLGHPNMSDASNEVLEIDGLLLRMESSLFKGEMTHQSPFKMEGKSPMLRITDSIIAIEDVDHVGSSRLQLAWDKLIESSGNVFLNLSDTPLPADYPMPPKGFTVLQGKDARNYWEDARDDWVAAHKGEASAERIDKPVLSAAETAIPEVEPTLSEVKSIRSEPDANADMEALGAIPGVSVSSSGKIVLDSAVFTSLQAGHQAQSQSLGAKYFEVAARADDKDDYIMYKWKTGELFYDHDGRGSTSQIQIAQLDPRLKLTHSDFVVTGTDAQTSGNRTDASAVDDEFVFDRLPMNGDSVTIPDFDPLFDQFVIDSSVFRALRDQRGGQLDESSFEVAARADDKDDYIMYKWKTGELFYDPDGRGSAGQIEIAQLEDRMSLDESHFLII